ncbi:hypothetical protein BV898_12094 [Hypsibius exemplaris]|uniref:G-protein coupled receptors family 1 profile domain-containing protein n=1 Tax=Hypsibius exemplaris TaxID=2072580 RepID=A0A1W0WER2_HYPEX|nr:hypothetical protein BV898_12094 [Hypsibius exemplaris]
MNYSNKNGSSESPITILPLTKQRELTAWIATTLAVSVIGILNNIFVLRVTWPVTQRISGVSLLISHFVVVNLLICLVSLPASIFVIILTQHYGSLIAGRSCYYIQTLWIVNVSVVNWSDAGLVGNRFVALYFPHSYKLWMTTRVSAAIIVGSWILCIGVMLPFTLASVGQRVALSALGQCSLVVTGRLGSFFNSFMAFVPYAVSGTGSLFILRKCFGFSKLRSGRVRHEARVQADATANRRLITARMLLFTFLWCGVCMLPTYLTIVVFPWLYVSNSVSILWTKTAMACQYAFTPCILLLTNRIIENERESSLLEDGPPLSRQLLTLHQGDRRVQFRPHGR